MTTLTLQDLRKPLSPINPKAWYFGSMRALMSTIGRLSNGIDIGYTYGFDSGVMLEYVYQNKSKGKFGLGKVLDRAYLNSPGWKGIRGRGELINNTIVQAIREKAEANPEQPISVIDLACGGGRYVLEALQEIENADEIEVNAILRDYRRENIGSALRLSNQFELDVRIEQGDAFSDFDLEDLYDSADIVIVSGLHEIIDDDGLVENHFNQIHKILKEDGIFINTIQPNHPQLEFIARVLPSHTGNAWAMSLRSVEQTTRWIEKSGFSVDKYEMEEQNIFGVLQARK